MKIIFHENQLCYRGTSNALFDYATYNEEISWERIYHYVS